MVVNELQFVGMCARVRKRPGSTRNLINTIIGLPGNIRSRFVRVRGGGIPAKASPRSQLLAKAKGDSIQLVMGMQR